MRNLHEPIPQSLLSVSLSPTPADSPKRILQNIAATESHPKQRLPNMERNRGTIRPRTIKALTILPNIDCLQGMGSTLEKTKKANALLTRVAGKAGKAVRE